MSNDPVLLKTCADNVEASALRAFLEANGIPAFIQGENHRAALGVMGAFIQLNVMVPESSLKKALELLKEAESEPADLEALPEAEDLPTVSPFGKDALCPLHSRPATSTCARCGAFQCPLCGSQAPGSICPSCDALAEPDARRSRARRVRGVAIGILLIILLPPVLLGVLDAVLHLLGR